MGHQIIKQPNDKYCVYSSITESVICWEATEEEILDYYADIAAKKSREATRELLDKVNKGDKPYYQFTLSWDDVKHTVPDTHFAWSLEKKNR